MFQREWLNKFFRLQWGHAQRARRDGCALFDSSFVTLLHRSRTLISVDGHSRRLVRDVQPDAQRSHARM